MNKRIWLITIALIAMTAAGLQGIGEETKPVAKGTWDVAITLPRPPRRGKPQKPSIAHLWLPKDEGKIRGLILAGKIRLESQICNDPAIRKAASDKRLGIVYFEPHFNAVFSYATTDSEDDLQKALNQLAKKTARAELATVPWITIGHSTGGIFCRNVAFWKPERVIGVIHIMSGNFQDHIQDKTRSLAGVPFLAINGEFEDCGPAGGDIGRGLRAAYSLHPTDKKKRNQSQWILIRMQMMARRRKNPDNLMSLVVHRESGHVSWSDDMTALTAQFIRSSADARIPKTDSDGKAVVACRPLTAKDGWLSDADIKAPKFKPAPYGEYKGDKALAFWHVDEAMARAVEKYHARGWKDADPTAGQPADKRYTPSTMLQDTIDSKEVK
ncbi:MAG: hypothetical protein QGH60_17065 [Phycisphaerae bacterium]|jgi:hypothetical protein|nr:hypothetical protein [Phycisphaerae bacterium]